MLSVIIPTFNSERTIKRLLDSFYVRPISTEYEIIIVDGCSTDSTIKICSEYNVKIINNPKIHAASARNIGVANSQGDIVAFIDSDCIACPMWIDKIYQVFTNKDIVAIGGRMIQNTPSNDIEEFSGRVFVEVMIQFPVIEKEISIDPFPSIITANCAYRKDFFISIGGFDESCSNYLEDLDLFYRAYNSHSGKMLYLPEIFVKHSFPNTKKWLFDKYKQYGIGSSIFLISHNLRRKPTQLSHHIHHWTTWFRAGRQPKTKFSYVFIYLFGLVVGKTIGHLNYKKLTNNVK